MRNKIYIESGKLYYSNMETCVLIPQEFSLALTSAENYKNFREQVASLFTTTSISQGKLFYPSQGTIRLDKLDLYSIIDDDDVSTDLILITKIS